MNSTGLLKSWGKTAVWCLWGAGTLLLLSIFLGNKLIFGAHFFMLCAIYAAIMQAIHTYLALEGAKAGLEDDE